MVLGTVQLGLDYGIANQKGKPAFKEAFEIVDTARMEGIKFFDTAQAYGESEKILGLCFGEMRKKVSGFNPCVITKLRPDIDPTEISTVLREIDASLKRLGIEKLWGFMLHRESWLDMGRKTLSKAILEIKSEERFAHFGISIYSPEKAVEALHTDGIDIIQLPFNVFDQRVLDSKIFPLADKMGKRVFIRSIYLQGLLLMAPSHLPSRMARFREDLERYRTMIGPRDVSRKLAALAFVVRNAPKAFFVLGAETPEQVAENASLYRKALETTLPDLNSLARHDPQLINPSLWN